MSKKSKLNIELLKRLQTRFLRMKHPEHFNMREVAMKTERGTAMCIAGHVLDLCGYRIRWQDGGDHALDAVWYKPSGRRVGDLFAAMDEAQRVLGMSYEQARSSYGLFMRLGLKTPQQAVAAIQQIINAAEGASQ